MAANKTSFGETNQPVRKRGKSVRTKILEAMEREGKNEDGFYDLLVQRAFSNDDNFSFGELLRRFSPIPKPVAPMVEFEFDKDAKPHIQASQILDAIASKHVPPDIGVMFISSIKSMVDIEEYTDLKDRIEKLESLINGESQSSSKA